MHFTPTIRLPASKCSTLSTSANGYLCGRTLRMFSGTVNTAAGWAMPLLISSAVGPDDTSSASSAILSEQMLLLRTSVLVTCRPATCTVGPTKAWTGGAKSAHTTAKSTPTCAKDMVMLQCCLSSGCVRVRLVQRRLDFQHSYCGSCQQRVRKDNVAKLRLYVVLSVCICTTYGWEHPAGRPLDDDESSKNTLFN